MKFFCAITAMLCLTCCVTKAEMDLDRAYSACRSMPAKSKRDACIARALQQAERERQAAAERQRQLDEAAEKRETDRAIAGLKQD